MSLYINRYNAIKKSWKFFKNSSKNKKIRIRDAAKQLNTSEAELITTELSSDSIYLNIPDYEQFLKQFVKIDKLMVLVRNDYIVHEKVIKGNELLFSVNKVFNIDAPGVKSLLSIAPKIFKYAFYIKKNHAGHELRSYQLFGYNGDSILKIYLKGNDISYFEKIKDNYIVNYNFELQKQITNSKDLISLKNKIDSKSICNFLSNKNSFIKEILLMISNMKMSVEIQVLGFDIIQSHYGLINKIVDYGPWVNVMDKEFNLHILESGVTRSNFYDYNHGNKKNTFIEFVDKENNALMRILFDNNNYKTIINNLGVANEK